MQILILTWTLGLLPSAQLSSAHTVAFTMEGGGAETNAPGAIENEEDPNFSAGGEMLNSMKDLLDDKSVNVPPMEHFMLKEKYLKLREVFVRMMLCAVVSMNVLRSHQSCLYRWPDRLNNGGASLQANVELTLTVAANNPCQKYVKLQAQLGTVGELRAGRRRPCDAYLNFTFLLVIRSCRLLLFSEH
eukprot:jgi/Bigna1/136149/aug1.32_g10857